MRLLLIEDEAAMRITLHRAFTRQGMDVHVSADGLSGLEAWRSLHPHVVVLDLTLPHLDGIEVLRRARDGGLDTPVILITARSSIGDRILGLNTGADDYLCKPFDLNELEARIRALYRRCQSKDNDHEDTVVAIGDVRYDRRTDAIYTFSGPIALSAQEQYVFKALAQRVREPVSKERLHAVVFGDSDIRLAAVEVVMYRLRRKLLPYRVSIQNIRGLGYLLQSEKTLLATAVKTSARP